MFESCRRRGGIATWMKRTGDASRRPSPTSQLRDLNPVAAGVDQLSDGRSGDVGRRHRELGAPGLDAVEVGLDVAGEEHRRRLVLLKQGLLIRLRRRIVVQRQLQFGAVWFL